jgi:hypothetical protein
LGHWRQKDKDSLVVPDFEFEAPPLRGFMRKHERSYAALSSAAGSRMMLNEPSTNEVSSASRKSSVGLVPMSRRGSAIELNAIRYSTIAASEDHRKVMTRRNSINFWPNTRQERRMSMSRAGSKISSRPFGESPHRSMVVLNTSKEALEKADLATEKLKIRMRSLNQMNYDIGNNNVELLEEEIAEEPKLKELTAVQKFRAISKDLVGSGENNKWHKTIAAALSKNHGDKLTELLKRYQEFGLKENFTEMRNVEENENRRKLSVYTASSTQSISTPGPETTARSIRASISHNSRARSLVLAHQKLVAKGKKWRVALASFILGLRLASLYKNVVAEYAQLISSNVPADVMGFANQLRQFADLGDPQFSQKVSDVNVD